MYVSMYNSPFPKLNPKVRYKTALERAGFEVKQPQQQEKFLKQSKSTPNLKNKFNNNNLPILNGSVPNIVVKRQSLTVSNSSSESRKNSLFNFETNHLSSEEEEDRFNDTRITSQSEEEEPNKNLLKIESHQQSGVVSIDLNSDSIEFKSSPLQNNNNNSSEEVLTPLVLTNNDNDNIQLLNDNIQDSVDQLSIPDEIVIRETTPLSIIENSTHPELKFQEIVSLTSPLKLEEEEEIVEPITDIISTSHDNELRKLIDQLDDVVLPKEEALSNHTSNLELPSNKAKKSSFYLSGVSINSNDKKLLQNEYISKYETGTGPCRSCGDIILDNARFANELSGQWHKNCFRCIKCNNKFNKTHPCYILDDQPYCQLDYHVMNHTICQICDTFIEGECLENDKNERFHVHCLTCFLCKEVIKNDYFIFNGNIPICGEHDMDQLIKDGIIEFDDTPTTEQNTIEKRRTRLLNL